MIRSESDPVQIVEPSARRSLRAAGVHCEDGLHDLLISVHEIVKRSSTSVIARRS
jgi:hypothetical protein